MINSGGKMEQQSQNPPSGGEQKGSHTTTIVIIILVMGFLLLAGLGLAGCGIYYWLKNASQNVIPTPTFSAIPLSSSTPSASPTNTSTSPSAESASQVIENYLKYTLGGIPGAEINYDAAKNYLGVELKEEFKDASFVPLSFCIQDGPSDVKIQSVNTSGNVSEIKVSAKYGNDWLEMWQFSLISGAGSWKIKEIRCLQAQ